MKKVLFITKNMACGGVERTLLNLLSALDPGKYSVELLLLEAKGEFLEAVPGHIKVQEARLSEKWLAILKNSELSWKAGFRAFWKQKKYGTAVQFAFLKLRSRLAAKCGKKSPLFDKCSKKIKLPAQQYDIVCDYHGYGYVTTYLAARFDGAKKFSWIHIENIDDAFRSARELYPRFDGFFGVSPRCLQNFSDAFPEVGKERLVLLYNLIPKEDIRRAGMQPPSVHYDGRGRFRMVSVGRLSTQKGFDLALEAANVLKSRGREFLWIIIGDGPERANLEAQIAEGGLQQDVILHGQDNNPYAYMAGADLYVQTSRFEGFATTLSEAVVLEKPMVSTTFSGVDQQIVDGKNGLLTAFDKNALADRIEQMMFDAALRQRCADGCREIVLPMDQTLQTLDRMFR